MCYRIEYSKEAIEHLRELDARQRTLIFDAVDKQQQGNRVYIAGEEIKL